MKVTGTRSWICFDLENGYSIKATGELLSNHRFAVDTDSLKKWEPPHENEFITKEQIKEIMDMVEETINKSEGCIIKIFFD